MEQNLKPAPFIPEELQIDGNGKAFVGMSEGSAQMALSAEETLISSDDILNANFGFLFPLPWWQEA